MTLWRYTARFVGDTAEITRPYPCYVQSEDAAHEGLHRFLDFCQVEHGDKLRWASLERSDSAEHYYDFAEWLEVERLAP